MWMICFTMEAQTNRALIVTIGQYPPESGWELIHTENDRRLTFNLLIDNHYNPQDIQILSNSQATKGNIVEAFNNLFDRCRKDDYIYIHFSCHRQQMMDDNGDEDDGLDEALIPYDALFWYLPDTYEGKNHLRDDELGKWLLKLRNKIGQNGQIIVVLDACHSGTGNRDNNENSYVRGTSRIFAPDNYVPLKGKHPELDLKLEQSPKLAPTLVISACKADQNNYEYYSQSNRSYYGVLSFCMANVLGKELKGKQWSVKTLTEKIHAKMQTLNRPYIYRKQQPYIEYSDKNHLYNLSNPNK